MANNENICYYCLNGKLGGGVCSANGIKCDGGSFDFSKMECVKSNKAGLIIGIVVPIVVIIIAGVVVGIIVWKKK